MIRNDGAYFDSTEQREHGAFSFCYGWGDNVVIHTPTRYAQATRDYFKMPIVRHYLNYGILTDGMYDKMHILQMLAYVVNHDRKHIYEICKSIQDTKCIVLTDYSDIPTLIEISTLNGAIAYNYNRAHNEKNWPSSWYKNGPQKPLVMRYKDYAKSFSDFKDIPVHLVDTPIDGECGIKDLIPFECELHIYPVMGRLYSCLLRIADSHEEVYLEQVDYAIKTCIPALDFDDELDEQKIKSLREKLAAHKKIIKESTERLAKEHDLDFITLIEKKAMAGYDKFYSEYQNIPRDVLEQADNDLYKDFSEMRMAYSKLMRTIYRTRREIRRSETHE